MLVSGTSAVGTRYRSQSPAILNRSASNFGRLPVPVSEAAFTMNGGSTSRYPCSRVCRSSMKSMSARESRAPAPRRNAKRARAIFAARSKSRMPSAAPRSQCALGVKSNRGGSPTRRTSALCDASRANRHRAVRQVGHGEQHARALLFEGLQLRVELLDALTALAVGIEDTACVLPKSFEARHFLTRRVLRPLQVLDFDDEGAAALVERSQLGEQAAGVEAAVLQGCSDAIGMVAQRRRGRSCRDPILAVRCRRQRRPTDEKEKRT